jgi:hypothetical protein
VAWGLVGGGCERISLPQRLDDLGIPRPLRQLTQSRCVVISANPNRRSHGKPPPVCHGESHPPRFGNPLCESPSWGLGITDASPGLSTAHWAPSSRPESVTHLTPPARPKSVTWPANFRGLSGIVLFDHLVGVHEERLRHARRTAEARFPRHLHSRRQLSFPASGGAARHPRPGRGRRRTIPRSCARHA